MRAWKIIKIIKQKKVQNRHFDMVIFVRVYKWHFISCKY